MSAVQLFLPYGASGFAWGTMPTAHNYTDQLLDSVMDLLYYGARYYDPLADQFVSADSVQGNPSGINPYGYVGGNPETATDPSGQMGCPDVEACGGGGGNIKGGGGGGGTGIIGVFVAIGSFFEGVLQGLLHPTTPAHCNRYGQCSRPPSNSPSSSTSTSTASSSSDPFVGHEDSPVPTPMSPTTTSSSAPAPGPSGSSASGSSSGGPRPPKKVKTSTTPPPPPGWYRRADSGCGPIPPWRGPGGVKGQVDKSIVNGQTFVNPGKGISVLGPPRVESGRWKCVVSVGERTRLFSSLSWGVIPCRNWTQGDYEFW